MSRLTSDLVRDSRIDTRFLPDTKIVHTYATSDVGVRQRRSLREETWQKQRLLGRGGFGEVWLQRCIDGQRLGQLRAVKEVPKGNGSAVDYTRELEAIAKFSHKKYRHCFVQSYGWYEHDTSMFITMEFLERGDLQKYLGRPLPESQAQKIAAQLIEGLNFMHENDFAHRDLKPQNILVVEPQPGWWVKIGDFGLSKRTVGTGLTSTLGTLRYQAPELRFRSQQRSYGVAVDIWAVGQITFQMITSRPAFSGDDAGDDDDLFGYYRQSNQFPETLLVRRKASRLCRQFIKSTMAASPDDRPKAKDLVQHDWLTKTSPSMERPPQTDNELSFPPATSNPPQDQDPVRTDPSATWSSVDHTEKLNNAALEASRSSQSKRDTTLQFVRDTLTSMNKLANAQIKQRQKEIEEQKKAAEGRAKLEKLRIEAEKQEREQAVDELQKDSAIQYQTSRIQERRVGAVIDALRVLLNSGGYPQVVWGIKLRGRGMVGEGAEGQSLPDYSSVERNGMNVWCDCCRVPVGQGVSYVCYYCDFRICMSCWGLGRGCLNRSHLLVEDQYWPSRPSNCPRLRQPELPLWCDNAWCRKPISGFYLHCCCGGAELDFCETCVLSRSARCFSQLHALFWGVRPLPMGLSDTRVLCGKGIKYPQEAIQVTAQTTQAWLNTSTRPLVLSRSVFRYKMVEQQLERLREAQRAGNVTVQLDTDISYCDFCLAPIRTKAHYLCQGDHPETGYSGANVNLAICQPCYVGGVRCPSNHAMVYIAATFTNCSREIHAPTSLTCDTCRKKMVQETYFHCCREGDDFDVCVDCVLDGWACPNATGDHVLRMFHLVAC